jgi:hypothetical protein
MATLGASKKLPLLRGGCYSEIPPIQLVLIWDVWLLLTGGRCPEVVINTELTVFLIFRMKINRNKRFFS